ncbi:MBOAT family O-acyltransferase [Sporosarcina siberiensis]|uniref:MBOAT family O-acyltransferase n=1 Tax=Sporosarcina siberiensis TaxID=1365606 RepID=A0ABW4SIS0_9BACL
MLFNSFEFIFVFLPIVFVGYYLFNKINFNLSKFWLLAGSLFFYSWWNPIYLPLILSSMIVNFFIGTLLGKLKNKAYRQFSLVIGLVFNIGLMGYFKYYDFFITNINTIFSTDLTILHLVLPLAISFFTFQQIGYLVDSYRYETKGYRFLNYALFVSFFPQLIAGPIVHHSHVIPQFENRKNKVINYSNISLGIFIFTLGLFKKIGIADTFAVWATTGYGLSEQLSMVDAWITSLSYTLQIYFDFSGYSDMAIGLGLLFNIKLPFNFNSPYKALSIQDFWRRWHITLSSFLTKYIYIPLGGSRKGIRRTYIHILIVFFISGFWHGAGWTFVLWGLAHGVASVIYRWWSTRDFVLPKVVAWFITFQFINITWVLFRAPDFQVALNVMKAMFGFGDSVFSKGLISESFFNSEPIVSFEMITIPNVLVVILMVVLFFLITVFAKNTNELGSNFKPNIYRVLFTTILFVYSVFQLQKVSEFLYFNF